MFQDKEFIRQGDGESVVKQTETLMPKVLCQRRVRRLDTHSISLYKINLVDRFGVAFTFARSVFVYGDAHKGPLRVIRREVLFGNT